MKTKTYDPLKTNLGPAARTLRAMAGIAVFVPIVAGYMPSVEWKLAFSAVGFHLGMSAAMGWDPLIAVLRLGIAKLSVLTTISYPASATKSNTR